jgi:dipeptidyl aminopeptidase/acylaminoacyl peptidase
MAGIDLLIERGIADAGRLGILGHSYGGVLPCTR